MFAAPLATYVNAAAKTRSIKNKIYSNIFGVSSSANALGNHRVNTANEIMTSHLKMNVKNTYKDTRVVMCRLNVSCVQFVMKVCNNTIGA